MGAAIGSLTVLGGVCVGLLMALVGRDAAPAKLWPVAGALSAVAASIAAVAIFG